MAFESSGDLRANAVLGKLNKINSGSGVVGGSN
jgi:hypothetical protein